MEILVNQEPLSYTLETEQELGEVIDGLAHWLRGEQYAITAIDVDDKSMPIHDRSRWESLLVESVGRLSVEAFPLAQVEQITLGAIGEYCLLVGRAIDDEDSSALRELAEELPYVRGRITEYFPAVAAGEKQLDLLSDEALGRGEVPRGEALVTVKTQLSSIGALVDSRLREYRNPVPELAMTLGQLVGCAEPLTRVPVQLQTGEENQAMATVILFAELLSRVIRILPLVEPESDLDTAQIGEFAHSLTPILTQLQEAFEIEDSVLVGDLLEYEVAPRLAQLPSLVPHSGPDDQEPVDA